METTVRVAPGRRRAEEWALVLLTADIPYRVEKRPDGWALCVRWADAERARETLAAYDEDMATSEMVAEYGATPAGLVMVVLLVAVYAVIGGRAAQHPAFLAGSAVAERIVAGEPWRTVTALTLHADLQHLAGNVVFGAVVATGVCRAVGPGVGAVLLLLAGVAGNLGAAYLYQTAHSSVGASTAIFGAVGILSGMAAVRRRHRRPSRVWVPFGAGLALLALLGTSERADLVAHLFGLLAGVPLGVATALALPRPLDRPKQATLTFAALAAVAASWTFALG